MFIGRLLKVMLDENKFFPPSLPTKCLVKTIPEQICYPVAKG